MTDKELSNSIQKWFDRNKDNPNKWNNNLTGKIIKKNLQLINNWKNAPRGNARKGYKLKGLKEKYNTAVENGLDISYEEFKRSYRPG